MLEIIFALYGEKWEHIHMWKEIYHVYYWIYTNIQLPTFIHDPVIVTKSQKIVRNERIIMWKSLSF